MIDRTPRHMPRAFGDALGVYASRFRYWRINGDEDGRVWAEGADHPDGPYTRLEDEAAVERLTRPTSDPEGA